MHDKDHVKKRERFIVTVKPHPHEGTRPMFKIIGPNNTGIQLRDTKNLDDAFVRPFLNGAKQIKARAWLNNHGRWCLEEVVLPGGVEPLVSVSTAQRSNR
jgi:hypothetical protein